jgi:hypothetical protein
MSDEEIPSEDFPELPSAPAQPSFTVQRREKFRTAMADKAAMRGPTVPAEHWQAYQRASQLIDSFFCFLDLLGTRGARSDEDAQAHLAATRQAMATATQMIEHHRPGRWFSDNLGTFIPVTAAVPQDKALEALLAEAAAVQFALTAEGFATRGGISRGLFFADETFIHGPALERAYILETQRAVFPRVVLDEASIAVAAAHTPDTAEHDWRRWLLKDRDGTVFVDYLFAVADGLAKDAWLIDGLTEHREMVQTRLHRFDGVKGVQEKYRWLAGYHNNALDRLASTIDELGGDLAKLRVICSRPADDFGAFTP